MQNSDSIRDGSSSNFPVMALSVDLGKIQSIENPVTWAIGFVRDPVINYTSLSGETQLRSPYFRARYATDAEAVSAAAVG